jgi:hypothetical protein
VARLTYLSSAVFQAGGLVVVLVEVTRKAYLASIVPVIVNAILNDHQVVADIVAFVSHGDFPRSRLGEKQRGKILGSWVTKKMRTIAQFSIRDADSTAGHMADLSARMSRGSKNGSIMGSSLRRSTLMPDNESTTRSPAPVKEENGHDIITEPYQRRGDEEERHYQEILNTSGYELSDRPRSEYDSADLAIPSPLKITNMDGSADSPSTVVPPTHGFNFGEDFPQQSPTDDYPVYEGSSGAVPSFEVVPPPSSSSQGSDAPAPLQVRNKGRDSLPSQQKRFSSLPAGMNSLNLSENSPHGAVNRQHHVDDNIEDWPQEALLYQSRLG